jgi:hypothetical protein
LEAIAIAIQPDVVVGYWQLWKVLAVVADPFCSATDVRSDEILIVGYVEVEELVQELVFLHRNPSDTIGTVKIDCFLAPFSLDLMRNEAHYFSPAVFYLVVVFCDGRVEVGIDASLML